MCQIHFDRLHGAEPTHTWSITLCVTILFIFWFLWLCTSRPNGEFDMHAKRLRRRGFAQGCAFGVLVDMLVYFEVQTAKPLNLTPKGEFTAKSQTMNKSWVEQDRQKIPAQHTKAASSNWLMTSFSPLAAKTTARLSWSQHNFVVTGKRWGQMDDDCSQNANRKAVMAYRMVILLPLGGATWRRLPVQVYFCRFENP